MVDINLGGKAYPVQIDTGSSDLWISGDVLNAKDTGFLARVNYAVGTATGKVLHAPMSLGGYDVPAQDFIYVTDVGSFGINITELGYAGILGLGPSMSSVVLNRIKDSTAVPPMDSIFRQYMTTQNYMTILLSRDGDPDSPATGQMTISEPIPGHESILQQFKLPIVIESKKGNLQHWSGMTDLDGIIGPDGKPIIVSSNIPVARGAGNGRLVALFDTGYSLPQVPKVIADAIYAHIPGAYFNAGLEGGLWTLPCTEETSITFVFGGQKIFIHPLDVSMSEIYGDILEPINGSPCALEAYFQPIQSPSAPYDMILGMGFLRNAYTLFDYGNFLYESPKDSAAPYIQLLSLANPADAHADFVNVRVNKSTSTNTGPAPTSMATTVVAGKSNPTSK
ncbi:hypothetical protein FRB93_007809 [Tulasnella sp. JGI-2019a]|nr:hypothetical protein FRB93_007809 [Tulasnella sp. JGI-2019a]